MQPRPPYRTVPDMLYDYWRRPEIRLGVYVVLGWLIFRAAHMLSSVLGLIAVAYALAYLVNPLLEWLERRGLGRAWSALLLLLVALTATGLLFWTLAAQVVDLVKGLPVLADQLTGRLEPLIHKRNEAPGVDSLQTQLFEYLRDKLKDISQNIGPALEQVLPSNYNVMDMLGRAMGQLASAGFVLTLALYFMLDYEHFGEGVLHLFPRDWQPRLRQLSQDVSQSFGVFVRGQLLTGLAVAVLAGIGLLLLKVPNALALALLTGVLYLVPFVGIILATIPPLLQAMPQGTPTLIGVAVLYFVLNQVGGNIVGPMIMGRTARLSPSVILIAVLVGLSVAGVAGAFLAVPTAILLQRWGRELWIPSRAYQGETGAEEVREKFQHSGELPKLSEISLREKP